MRGKDYPAGSRIPPTRLCFYCFFERILSFFPTLAVGIHGIILLRDVRFADRTTVHGFRSSFRDLCAETDKPCELAEAALAHPVGGVEGAYFRSDLIKRRRRLMEDWARYLTGTRADVVRLHG